MVKAKRRRAEPDKRVMKRLEGARAAYTKAEDRLAVARARLARAEARLATRTARLSAAESDIAALATPAAEANVAALTAPAAGKKRQEGSDRDAATAKPPRRRSATPPLGDAKPHTATAAHADVSAEPVPAATPEETADALASLVATAHPETDAPMTDASDAEILVAVPTAAVAANGARPARPRGRRKPATPDEG